MQDRSQSDKAYRELRKGLMSQSIRPGSRITEQKWADFLGVNRGDIRQAMGRLLAEGLVHRGERGGFFAREYSREDIRQANEARLILETAAARLAVERAGKEDLEELEEICRHMELMAANHYEMGFSETDVRFHETLVQAAHNAKLMDIYRKANIPISHISFARPEEMHRKLDRDYADHRAMADALRDKDADTLVRLLENGLRGTLE